MPTENVSDMIESIYSRLDEYGDLDTERFYNIRVFKKLEAQQLWQYRKKSKKQFIVIPAKAWIKQFQYVMDAGSVIPDLIRDRHDGIRLFTRASAII